MFKMLIADDNKQITNIISDYAKRDGYTTTVASNGLEALEKFHTECPQIILLDVMMPLMDGFEVCREIRKKSNVPIIMITARSEDYEKIMGLDIGADDYVTKPFSPGEVMARVRAAMRRITGGDLNCANIFELDGLSINLSDYTVCIHSQPVPLTKKEIEILWTLATNSSKVFSRENLLDSIWGYDYFGDIRTVDSHIKRLRAKLESFDCLSWEIKTIWGVGYKFEVTADDKK